VIRFLADQVLVLEHGHAVELSDAESLYRAPQHAYTQRLLAAVPTGPRSAALGILKAPGGT
jgi:ABC-type microcin C transport system duplicated ATPase subunit YejF